MIEVKLVLEALLCLVYFKDGDILLTKKGALRFTKSLKNTSTNISKGTFKYYMMKIFPFLIIFWLDLFQRTYENTPINLYLIMYHRNNINFKKLKKYLGNDLLKISY